MGERLVRWIRRTLISLGIAVVVAVVATPVYFLFAGWHGFPQTYGELEVEGLERAVDVHRDTHGIPTIVASTPHDLWFAQGYVHAQDRFWEMDFRRHVTSGRLSELFGSSQIGTDKFLRAMGWYATAEAELELIDDETRLMLDAYAQGVNAWLEGRRGTRLSFEHSLLPVTGAWWYRPEPWQPADSLAWIKAMAWDLSSIEDDLVRARLQLVDLGPDRDRLDLYPSSPAEHPPIIVDGGGMVDGHWQPAEAHAGQFGAPTDEFPSGEPDGTGDEPAGTSSGPEGEPEIGNPDPLLVDPALGTTPNVALERLAAGLDSLTLPHFIGRGDGVGSNSWVVAPHRSATGSTMLANDPHLEPSQPSVWYQVRLRCRVVSANCPYQVNGFSFAGLPGVVIGHTAQVAWGLTNLNATTSELVLEQLDGDRYRAGDRWRELEQRNETIRVAFGRDIDITIRATHHGPLLSDVFEDAEHVVPARRPRAQRRYDEAVALRWVALQPALTANAIPRLARVTNWNEFLEALQYFDIPSQSVVYADADGNIGYVAAGRIPMSSADGRTVVAASETADDWHGTFGPHQRPWLLNPPSGVIVAANQAILPPRDEPALTVDPNLGFRASRIHDLLEGADDLTIDDLAAIQMDSYNTLATALVPALLAIDSTDDDVWRVQEVLGDWDYHDDADSAGAAAFNVTWRHVLAHTFHDELPEWAHPEGGARWWEVIRRLLERPNASWWDDLTTVETERRDDILQRALSDASQELQQQFGSAPWRWDDLHQLTLTHATFGSSGIAPIERLFNRGPFGLSGSKDVVNATGWDASEGYDVDWLPSMRMIVDFSDLDNSRWIQLTGQSGRPFHHHYVDQIELWQDGGYLPMVFSNAAIDTLSFKTLTLHPQ
ncbi:MAG: penicillin acylase family protein [Nitriliruptoraceae bacterium]